MTLKDSHKTLLKEMLQLGGTNFKISSNCPSDIFDEFGFSMVTDNWGVNLVGVFFTALEKRDPKERDEWFEYMQNFYFRRKSSLRPYNYTSKSNGCYLLKSSNLNKFTDFMEKKYQKNQYIGYDLSTYIGEGPFAKRFYDQVDDSIKVFKKAKKKKYKYLHTEIEHPYNTMLNNLKKSLFDCLVKQSKNSFKEKYIYDCNIFKVELTSKEGGAYDINVRAIGYIHWKDLDEIRKKITYKQKKKLEAYKKKWVVTEESDKKIASFVSCVYKKNEKDVLEDMRNDMTRCNRDFGRQNYGYLLPQD